MKHLFEKSYVFFIQLYVIKFASDLLMFDAFVCVVIIWIPSQTNPLSIMPIAKI